MTQIGTGKSKGTRQRAVTTWLRLMRVHQKLERAAADDLRRSGLTVAQFDILAHVATAPGITQQDLAAARLTTKGNLSQLLDSMESCGLIRREREGRTKHVFLAERGAALVAEATPPHEALIAAQFCALSAHEQDQLHSLLRRLDRAL
jgi:DNA-binding MarR family transcriptional regulator